MQLKPHKRTSKEYSGNVQKMWKKNNHFWTNEQIQKLTNLATQKVEGAEPLKKYKQSKQNRENKSKFHENSKQVERAEKLKQTRKQIITSKWVRKTSKAHVRKKRIPTSMKNQTPAQTETETQEKSTNTKTQGQTQTQWQELTILCCQESEDGWKHTGKRWWQQRIDGCQTKRISEKEGEEDEQMTNKKTLQIIKHTNDSTRSRKRSRENGQRWTIKAEKKVGQPNETLRSPFLSFPFSFLFKNIQADSETESCNSNRTNDIKQKIQTMFKKCEKEQQLLNKGATNVKWVKQQSKEYREKTKFHNQNWQENYKKGCREKQKEENDFKDETNVYSRMTIQEKK
jgi:hypothetical protein